MSGFQSGAKIGSAVPAAIGGSEMEAAARGNVNYKYYRISISAFWLLSAGGAKNNHTLPVKSLPRYRRKRFRNIALLYFWRLRRSLDFNSLLSFMTP